MTGALTGSGPTLVSPTADAQQQVSVTQEIAQIADILEKEVDHLKAVGSSIESRLDALFGESIIPPETVTNDPEAAPTHPFARIMQSLHRMQIQRSRLESCCNRL